MWSEHGETHRTRSAVLTTINISGENLGDTVHHRRGEHCIKQSFYTDMGRSKHTRLPFLKKTTKIMKEAENFSSP